MARDGLKHSAASKVRISDTLSIEQVSIGRLRPNPRNPRTHSKKQIRQIGVSIRKLGFLNPIIIDSENMVLAGHGRLEGARLIGLTQVPVIRFDHLTPAQKRGAHRKPYPR
jgi:ParB-like chromosome segregation protein Spo0J